MTPEELEFNICQYLDGTLPAEQQIALEALLEQDAGARNLLAEHRKLDEAMKRSSPMPLVQWDRLANHLANAVEFGSEHLEQTVVQYVDGELSAEERAALEYHIADDAHGSLLLQQHRRLHTALRSMPQPRVHWNNLAAHLSDAVANAADPKPVKLSVYSWLRTAGGLAVAACVMLMSGLALHQHLHSHVPTAMVSHGRGGIPVAIVNVNSNAIKPSGPVVTDISIGAGNNVASAAPAEYADGIVVVQPSRGLIATSAGPAQDIQMPY